jgi:predicted O-methyltransferase YrrM
MAPSSRPTLLDDAVALIRTAFADGTEALCARIEAIHSLTQHPRGLDRIDQAFFLTALYTIVRRFHMTHIVQTGTYVGDSALAVALALHDAGNGGVLDTIDPEPSQYAGNSLPNPVDLARLSVTAGGLHDHVVFHRGYSTEPWDRSRGDQPVAPRHLLRTLAASPRYDLLVIDGDHSFEGVLWDLEIGQLCLRPDGPRMIFVHDYHGIHAVREGVRHWIRMRETAIDQRVYDRGCGFALLHVH